jgi:hypothetical protein
MSDRVARGGAAVLAGLVILIAAGWLEGSIGGEIERRRTQADDLAITELVVSLAYLAVVGAVLAVPVVIRWARSVLVAVVLGLVGAFFLLLGSVVWAFGAWINNIPPVLPEAIAGVLGDLYFWQIGPVGAVHLVAASMVVSAVVSLASAYRQRSPRASTRRNAATDPAI